jgi:hypothetical protein
MRERLYSRSQDRAKNIPCPVVKPRQIPAVVLVVLTSGFRHRVRKHHFDRRARMRAGSDVELRAVGLDQRQADAGILRGFVVLIQLGGNGASTEQALKILGYFSRD